MGLLILGIAALISAITSVTVAAISLTWQGIRNLNNEKYIYDQGPVDPECDCPTCRLHSRAYVRHLLRANELLAHRLTVQHNLYFYNTLMERIREALDNGTFEEFYQKYRDILGKRI